VYQSPAACSPNLTCRLSYNNLPAARWEAPLYVTRAPGRLDVMGGIADYSGSLVLQMPIAEACHVALQLHPLEAQPVWKHIAVSWVECVG
jgi:hypothetical protein